MTTEPIFVDPNTDNLNDFTDLFTGKAQVKEDDVKSETNEPDPVVEDEPEPADEQADAVDESESTDDSDITEVDEAEAKPVKKVNRVQERINELTAKAREAERALEALKAERQQQAEPAKPTQPTPAQSVTINPDAKNEDGSDKYPLGEYDPQYLRDFNRAIIEEEWNARKEQEAQENSQRQIEQARADIQSQWVAKLQPVTEQHEDFLEKTMELESAFDGLDPQYSDYLVQTIKSLEHGPEVLYYFANNLEEAHKFVKMGPLNATLVMGEINAMFKGQTRKAEQPKVSKAPPPPQVNKGSKTRVAVTADTDDLDQFSELFFKK